MGLCCPVHLLKAKSTARNRNLTGHTHTHTHAHIHTHTHNYAHTCTPHKPHTHTHIHTHAHLHTHTHTHAHTTHTHTHTCTHAWTPHTHTHTHTYTHIIIRRQYIKRFILQDYCTCCTVTHNWNLDNQSTKGFYRGRDHLSLNMTTITPTFPSTVTPERTVNLLRDFNIINFPPYPLFPDLISRRKVREHQPLVMCICKIVKINNQ